MGARTETRSVAKHFLGLVLVLVLLLEGCSSARKKPESDEANKANTTSAPEQMGPAEPFGPPQPMAPEVQGPQQIKLRPLVLVLGPGLARGFAYAGVLRAFEDANIPIAAIVGTEMGALVAALYATSETINAFEWKLFKFKDSQLQGPKGFIPTVLKKQWNGQNLEEALIETFEHTDLKTTRLPLAIGISREPFSSMELAENGEIHLLVRCSFAVPGVLEKTIIDGRGCVSSSKISPFAIEEAQKRFANIESERPAFILVDVISDMTEQSQRTEIKAQLERADLVLKPDLRGIDSSQFSRRTQISFRGKQSVLVHLKEIRQLLGLSADSATGDAQ